MRFRPTLIVLAAGRGTRFEHAQHKLVQPLAGRPLLSHAVAHAVQTQLPVLVVCTAPLAEWLAEQVATRDILVLSEAQAARGMGHSIAMGVAERSGAPGWVLLPGDMPLVQSASLLAVAGALEQHPAAYAQHRGRAGHPVGFSAELYSELVRLDGEEGMRRLLARYPAQACELDDAGVLVGVDTVADLQRLEEQLRTGRDPLPVKWPDGAAGLAARPRSRAGGDGRG